jgi:uncharacterized protein (DUF1330 family)
MKQLFLLLSIVALFQINLFAQKQPAYYLVTNSTESVDDAMSTVKTTLQSSGFMVIGEYSPAGSEKLGVVCYTCPILEKLALDFADRGALAATLKIGFKKDDTGVKISMLNPMYLFYAYFIEGVDRHEKELLAISEKAKTAMKNIGANFTPFGGELTKKELQKYHYKMLMPYFEDAEELKEFDSFEAGLKTIQENLNTGKGDTKKVYELVYADKKVAVFGVALLNAKEGEPHFLPIIGEENVAAMPYEIILQGKTASILPGKYRLAVSWPKLTMGTFMKIMSTPGDIEDMMEALTE